MTPLDLVVEFGCMSEPIQFRSGVFLGYLLLDGMPNDAGHFITVQVNNRVSDLNASILGV